jgi:para-aminobenzoate synthetase component 1
VNTPLITPLPYHPDSAALFEAIAERPWAVFLDSGRPAIRQGRFDVLAADPAALLLTRGAVTELRSRTAHGLSPQDPFALLRRYLEPRAAPIPGIPFCGGALGYFGYDLGRRLERLPVLAENDEQLPEMAVGIYDWAVVVDHDRRRATLVGQGRDPATRGRWRELVDTFSAPTAPARRSPFQVAGPIRSNLDRERYATAYRRIQDYIRAGDCYQVNLAQRFTVAIEGDPWQIYRALRCINPAPFGAYLNTPQFQVLSASPERFLRVTGGEVLTQPIKGTCARHPDPKRDRERTRALRRSAKDRAENLMIVDLLRNDLSKSCALGSVRVPRLFQVQSFATVHHLVSSVTGRLDQGRDALDLLRGCFPGGSITGAPKLRAMEIIEELEPHRRGVYCGTIGYMGFDGALDSNITIRTLVHARGRMSFWAGGGIVADSSLEGEYQESYDKAAAMLELLQGQDHLNHVGG